MLSVHPSPTLSPSHTHTHTHTHTHKHTHTQTYTHTHSFCTPSLFSMLTKYLFLFHFETSKELVFKAFSLLQSVHFICSVVSECVQTHGLQHTRIPCPSPTPRACWNSCAPSWWCHPTILSSVVPFSSCIFPSIRVSFSESVLHIRWPKGSFSFNISPSNEYSGLISFRFDWFDLLAVQGTLKSLL